MRPLETAFTALPAGCLNDTFQCRNGQCISWYFVCDGMKNCADGSDESSCKKHDCPSTSFQCDDGTCKSRASVCNGKWECPDGSDEARCYKGIKCDRNAFQCKNGQCLPKYVFCNAVVDCIDGSDEDEEACVKGKIPATRAYLEKQANSCSYCNLHYSASLFQDIVCIGLYIRQLLRYSSR